MERKQGAEAVVVSFSHLPLNPELEHLLQTQSPIPADWGYLAEVPGEDKWQYRHLFRFEMCCDLLVSK